MGQEYGCKLDDVYNNLYDFIDIIMQYHAKMHKDTHSKNNKLAVRLRLKKNTQAGSAGKKTNKQGPVCAKLKQQNNILNENINTLQEVGATDINISKYVGNLSIAYQQRIKGKNQTICSLVSKLRQVFKSLYAQAEKIQKHVANNPSTPKTDTLPAMDGQYQLTQIPNIQHVRLEKAKDVGYNKSEHKNNPTFPISNIQSNPLESDHKSVEVQSTVIKTQSQVFPTSQYTLLNNQVEQKGYENLIKINSQLRGQVSEMEHYIITLKEELNVKDKIIEDLEEDKLQFENVCKEMAMLLKEQEGRCRILEQEISGYEDKIDKKEQQTGSRIRSKSDLDKQILKLGQEDSREGRKRQNSNIEGNKHNHDDEEDEHEEYNGDDENDEKVNDACNQEQDRLQQIYAKTQQTLKKYQKLEKQLQNKQNEYNTIHKIIQRVLAYLNIDEQSRGEQLGDTMIAAIEDRIQQVHQQQSDRQEKLQQMIGQQLDDLLRILTIIHTPASSQNQESACVTIVDKIQKVTAIVSEMFQQKYNQQPILTRNNYFNNLMDYLHRLSQIMGAVDDISKQLQTNQQTLNQFIDNTPDQLPQTILPNHAINTANEQESKQSQMPANMGSIANNILQLQALLLQNQAYLTDQNIECLQLFKLMANDGINVGKINQYLTQLQSTVRSLHQYNTSDDAHTICRRQIEQLKNQIIAILNQHSNLIHQSQNLITKINNLIETQTLTDIQHEIQTLNQTIQASKKLRNKAITLVEPEQQLQIINKQANKIKNKYFPSNPELVDHILTKLMQLRKANSDHGFSQIVDSIFQSIKTKEDKLNQQIGRKKEVVKHKIATITSICKRGTAESSIMEDYVHGLEQDN